jgi:hypothetical protein
MFRGKTHHVLVLSGLSGKHNPLTNLSALYPAFGATNCSWLSIFNLVQQGPGYLWDSYKPQNIGAYLNVSALWLSWSKGDFLDGVRHLPSLQQIDQWWGSLKNKNKGVQQQAWHPTGNTTVC